MVESRGKGNFMPPAALRTHGCGDLRLSDAGTEVRLGGWLHRSRDLGGLLFLDLRDRSGMVQLSFDPKWTPPEVIRTAAMAGAECVLLVRGKVEERPVIGSDPGLATREIEVRVTACEVAGPALTPAIPVARREGHELPAEELRLRHRVLDLRRPELQGNLVLRHRLLQCARRTLDNLGFLEIETPILTRPTPEGARDYLVPSRVHAGEFYALPQSPQIYKQLLMIAGYDRYFQIARCFRDEDLRADRQPEFTQIDLEASFVSAGDVQDVVEEVLAALWQEAGVTIPRPFPRLSCREALERYGTDKPDLRHELELRDLTAGLDDSSAPFLREARDAGARFRALVVPGGAALSRKDLDGLTAMVKEAGAGGMVWARFTSSGWEGQGVKALGSSLLASIDAAPGSILLGISGPDSVSSPALDKLRHAVINRLGLTPVTEHAFCWVVDFPLFEPDPVTGEPVPSHHPFTAPHPDDLGKLEKDPASCRALHYDAVYNGNELGSGSIRITDPAVQSLIFRLLNIGEDEADDRFGFLLEGLRAGAPPHGGFALGLDRIAMLLAGASSLRDVIAFPKTTAARALYEGAPAPVTGEDLRQLHIALRSREGRNDG